MDLVQVQARGEVEIVAMEAVAEAIMVAAVVRKDTENKRVISV